MPEPNRNITLQCSALMNSQLEGRQLEFAVYTSVIAGAIGTSSRLQECRGLSSVGTPMTQDGQRDRHCSPVGTVGRPDMMRLEWLLRIIPV
ncbi:hypothetical protein quinque_008389 [Culex quinquefasciatus]